MPPALPGVAAFVQKVNDVLINPVLALIFTAALFLFLWGVFQFIVHGQEEAARDTGRKHMLWGIIGMVLMVSVFAILRVGLDTFGVTDNEIPADLPNF